jgi:hypothetical protein
LICFLIALACAGVARAQAPELGLPRVNYTFGGSAIPGVVSLADDHTTTWVINSWWVDKFDGTGNRWDLGPIAGTGVWSVNDAAVKITVNASTRTLPGYLRITKFTMAFTEAYTTFYVNDRKFLRGFNVTASVTYRDFYGAPRTTGFTYAAARPGIAVYQLDYLGVPRGAQPGGQWSYPDPAWHDFSQDKVLVIDSPPGYSAWVTLRFNPGWLYTGDKTQPYQVQVSDGTPYVVKYVQLPMMFYTSARCWDTYD